MVKEKSAEEVSPCDELGVTTMRPSGTRSRGAKVKIGLLNRTSSRPVVTTTLLVSGLLLFMTVSSIPTRANESRLGSLNGRQTECDVSGQVTQHKNGWSRISAPEFPEFLDPRSLVPPAGGVTVPDPKAITELDVDLQDSRSIFVQNIYGQSLLHSHDGGCTWANVFSSPSGWKITQVAVNGSYVYVLLRVAVYVRGPVLAPRQALFVSEDGAKTWSERPSFPALGQAAEIAVAPSDPTVVYATVLDPTTGISGAPPCAQAPVSVYRSGDAGIGWELRSDRIGNIAGWASSYLSSFNFGTAASVTSGCGNVHISGIHPEQSDVLWMLWGPAAPPTARGMYESRDGALSWSLMQAPVGRNSAQAEATTGDFAVFPAGAKTTKLAIILTESVAGSGHQFLVVSDDGGANWRPVLDITSANLSYSGGLAFGRSGNTLMFISTGASDSLASVLRVDLLRPGRATDLRPPPESAPLLSGASIGLINISGDVFGVSGDGYSIVRYSGRS